MIFKYHFIILLNTTLTVSLQNTHFPPFFISVGTAASANKSNRPKTHRGKKERLINSGSMRFNLRYIQSNLSHTAHLLQLFLHQNFSALGYKLHGQAINIICGLCFFTATNFSFSTANCSPTQIPRIQW